MLLYVLLISRVIFRCRLRSFKEITVVAKYNQIELFLNLQATLSNDLVRIQN